MIDVKGIFKSQYILDLIKDIPKEHHKTLKRLFLDGYIAGVADTQQVISDLVNIEPEYINEFGIYNSNSLDGG